MSTYAALWRFTGEGIKHMSEMPNITERVRKLCQDNGCALKDQYLCMGEYDCLSIIDAPNDQAIFAVLTGITSWGYAHTETMRCLPVEEYAAVLRKAA